MSHKLLTFLLLSACFLGINTSLLGQSAIPLHGIRGYLDPRTGIFHSIPHPDTVDEAEPPAKTTFAGTIVVNFTVTISSAIASTTQIGCLAGATVVDNSTTAIVEIATTAVTRGSGSTVACSVTIPYSWGLVTPAKDTVSVSYSIISPVNVATPAAEFPTREHGTPLSKFTVPATGTTTTLTATARI